MITRRNSPELNNKRWFTMMMSHSRKLMSSKVRKKVQYLRICHLIPKIYKKSVFQWVRHWPRLLRHQESLQCKRLSKQRSLFLIRPNWMTTCISYDPLVGLINSTFSPLKLRKRSKNWACRRIMVHLAIQINRTRLFQFAWNLIMKMASMRANRLKHKHQSLESLWIHTLWVRYQDLWSYQWRLQIRKVKT